MHDGPCPGTLAQPSACASTRSESSANRLAAV